MSEGSPQCFKFFPEKRGNWSTANATCATEGLMMALPTDAVAVALRKDLLYTYGKQLFLYLITKKDFHDKTFLLYLFMIIHISVCMFTFMYENV